VGRVAQAIGQQALNADLESFLLEKFAPGSTDFDGLESLVATGISQGWLCTRSSGGIAYGRTVKPGEEAGGFSVDVVMTDDVVGPHHVHTKGEIGMIMPITDGARFDGRGRGWYVYPPGSSHFPTVQFGKACILYLLPEGSIAFTGRTPS
jgi:hypothetical protein